MEVVLFQGEEPMMTTDLKITNGGTFMVGGPRYERGTLIISIKPIAPASAEMAPATSEAAAPAVERAAPPVEGPASRRQPPWSPRSHPARITDSTY